MLHIHTYPTYVYAYVITDIEHQTVDLYTFYTSVDKGRREVVKTTSPPDPSRPPRISGLWRLLSRVRT